MKSDNKEKIAEDDLKKLEEAVVEAKKSIESTEKEDLEKALKTLNDIIMPIGAKMYEEAEKSDTTPEEKTSKSDEPVEGEVVDEK